MSAPARAYYNEVDPFAAAWLRNLISAGHIADGDVDDRSIVDVRPADLAGYSRVHLFAGIGGWDLALRLAGWPEDRPVWTGSCPCQPFSSAGHQRGFTDPRHLWPEMFRLVAERHPTIVLGEQAEDAARLGWVDLVADDLEGAGYAFGSAILPACSVGAPHRRNREWFVAHREREGLPSGFQQFSYSDAVQPTPIRRGRLGFPIGAAWDSEPELALLVHGLPHEVATTVAFGNAIVPQAGAAWVEAVMGCCP